MSIKFCCLCCAASSEYKYLQNELGECNEIYEITVKYFDPILLTGYNNINFPKDSKILCHECWLHIKDFHDFQQTVIISRSLLQQTEIKELPLEIKLEKEQDTSLLSDEGLDDSDEEEMTHFDDMLIENSSEDKDTLGNGVYMNNKDDDEDDQNLLVELKKNKRPVKLSIENYNDIKNNEISVTEDQKTKSRKGRKPKDSTLYKAKNVCAEGEKGDKSLEKRKKLEDSEKSKKNPRINSALDKRREFDEFIAEWKPLLECDVCSETFPVFDLLKGHFEDKHNARCYIKCCERKFYRRSVLVEHIRLHINPETYKCDICGKSSSNKYILKLHKKVLHEETKQFECDVCHRSFNHKIGLERHLLTHVTGSKDFICKECGKGYVTEVQLKLHIKRVHSDKYPCDKCGALLRSRWFLKRHNEAYHNDGSTIYVCSICGKVAASELGLLSHKKQVHQDGRKHKCTYCDKAFKRPKFLREHIAIHTGEDLYQCPHCPKTFKACSHMHLHRKKVHPVEFEEGRKNRLQLRKVDITQVTNRVVI